MLQAKDGVSTFLTVDPVDDLGATLYADGTTVPCRQLADLHPDHIRKHWEAALDLVMLLLILVGPLLVDDAYGHSSDFTISSDP